MCNADTSHELPTSTHPIFQFQQPLTDALQRSVVRDELGLTRAVDDDVGAVEFPKPFFEPIDVLLQVFEAVYKTYSGYWYSVVAWYYAAIGVQTL